MSVTQVKPVAPTKPARRSSGFGALLLRLHFYAGIFVAPFVFVAALTGLAYTLTPQIDKLVYGTELSVASTEGTPRPLAEQVTAAREAHPDGTIATIRPGSGDGTTQVDFAVGTLTDDRQHTVYVDPYTAEVKGQLTTWFSETPVTTWFDDFHRNLRLGDLGRHYSEFAASWLAILALGGVALWWRRQRGGRKFFTPELPARKGVRRTRSWHAATGVWLTLGLLVLATTGLTWSRYAGGNFSAALDSLRAGKPSLTTGVAAAGGGHHGGSSTAGGFDPATVDTVVGVARANGLDGPLELTVPADATTAWAVAQNDDTFPVRKDRLAVDAANRTVVDRSDFADWPLLAKLTTLGVSAHMGNLFGPANQVLLALLAIGVLCVTVWGYRMWWQRRPTRAGRSAPVGAPPVPRGAWQRLPPWAIVVGVPIVIALGWVIPLFGIPLAGFLLVDVVVGAVRPRRRGPAVPVSPPPAGA